MKESTTRVLQGLTLFCVAVVGLFLNVTVILVFHKRPGLRSPSNRFVLSLVAANFISVLVLVPVGLYLLSRTSLDCISHIGSCLPVLVVTSSVFSILIIAIDRYNAVLSPLHYSMTLTSQRNKETIAAIWCVSLLLSTPPALGVFGKRVPHVENEVLTYSYATVLVIFSFIAPLVALTIVYSRMYTAAHKNSKRTRRQSIQASAKECSRGESVETQFPPVITTLDFIRNSKPPMLSQIHKRRMSNASFSAILFREESRAVKTAIMVIASFIICWGPFFVLLFLSAFELIDFLTHTTLFLSILLIVLNTIFSPFIYVFRNEIARNEAIKLLLWWKNIGLYEENVLQQANKELKLKTSESGIRIRQQSSSNCDSMSVQSFQLPLNYSLECKQCAEPSHLPIADFIATYEVVNIKEPSKNDEKVDVPDGKTKGESVTFRLAFLPQRRCQTCVRQNSDSSFGSAHLLLKESDSPTPIHAAKRPDLTSREKEDVIKIRFGESPKPSVKRSNKNQIILEMEEQSIAENTLTHNDKLKTDLLNENLWTGLKNETDMKIHSPNGNLDILNECHADFTEKFDTDLVEGIKSSRDSADMIESVICLTKKHRYKLQRVSAVEIEDGTKFLTKYPTIGDHG